MLIKETWVLFLGDADMPLIGDIIKRYEAQNAGYRQVDKSLYSENRDDIFLKTELRGDPVGKMSGLGSGSIWKAAPVKLNNPAREVSKEEVQERKLSLQEEVDMLRTENQELKSKLQQVNYA